MGLMDILQQYTNTTAISNPDNAQGHFDEFSGAVERRGAAVDAPASVV